MKQKRSEGVRRLFMLLSILLTLSWIGFVLVVTDGRFSPPKPSEPITFAPLQDPATDREEYSDPLGILKDSPARKSEQPTEKFKRRGNLTLEDLKALGLLDRESVLRDLQDSRRREAQQAFQEAKTRYWKLIVIFLAGIPIAFSIPQIIKLISYWLVDGFRKDRITG